jgi:hypothetical protein
MSHYPHPHPSPCTSPVSPESDQAHPKPGSDSIPTRLPSFNYFFPPVPGRNLHPRSSLASPPTTPREASPPRERPFSAGSPASMAASFSSAPSRPLPLRSNSSPHIHALAGIDPRRRLPSHPSGSRPSSSHSNLPALSYAPSAAPTQSEGAPPLFSGSALQRHSIGGSPAVSVPSQDPMYKSTSPSSHSASPHASIDFSSSRRRGRTATACKFCQTRKQKVNVPDDVC